METKKNILKKIALIQNSIDKITKNAQNPYYNSSYADLPNIQETLKPLLLEQSLLSIHRVENNHLITTIYDLDSSEFFESSIDIANLNDPQKVGSQLTYYRRYNLINIFDLKVEDDDANKTAQKPSNHNSTVEINVWLTDKQFTEAKSDGEKAKKTLSYFDGKTIQNDGKVYGMKKSYKTELEKII